MLYCEIEPYLQKSVIALAAILRPGGPANLFAGDNRMVGFWRKPSTSIVAVMSADAQGRLRQSNESSFKSPPRAIKSEIQSATSRRIVFHNRGDPSREHSRAEPATCVDFVRHAQVPLSARDGKSRRKLAGCNRAVKLR